MPTMKTIGHAIAVAYWIGALVFAARGGLGGAILVVVGDHLVNHVVFGLARGRMATALALAALVLFAAWSIGFCAHVLAHPAGPDSAMGILATSIYALPALFPLWVGSVWATRRARQRAAPSRRDADPG